jgi:hypothetical protein
MKPPKNMIYRDIQDKQDENPVQNENCSSRFA